MNRDYPYDILGAPLIECELRISKTFQTIFDLSRCLLDLQLVVSHFYEAVYPDAERERLHSSPRSLADRFAKSLSLRSFRSGSFLGSVSVSVTAAVIVKFLEAYFSGASSIGEPPERPSGTISLRMRDDAAQHTVTRILSGIDLREKDLDEVLVDVVWRARRHGLSGKLETNVDAKVDRSVRSLQSRIRTLGRDLDIYV